MYTKASLFTSVVANMNVGSFKQFFRQTCYVNIHLADFSYEYFVTVYYFFTILYLLVAQVIVCMQILIICNVLKSGPLIMSSYRM